MNVGAILGGFTIILVAILGLVGIIPFPASSQSIIPASLCVQSVTNINAFTIAPCPGSVLTQVDTIQYAGQYWLSNAANGAIQVTVGSGALVVYYETLNAPLQSWSLLYCAGSLCTPNQPITVTDSGVNANGVGQLTGSSLVLAVNQYYYFAASIKDASGYASSGNFALQYVQASYTLSFKVSAANTTKPLQGAYIQLYQNGKNSAPYATKTTDSSGTASFSVPPFQDHYFAYVSAKGGYIPYSSGLFDETTSPTITAILQTTYLPPPPPVYQPPKVYNDTVLVIDSVSHPIQGATVKIEFANNNTQVGSDMTTNSTGTTPKFGVKTSSKTVVQYIAYVTATGYADAHSTPFAPAGNIQVQVILTKGNTPPCIGSGCYPRTNLSILALFMLGGGLTLTAYGFVAKEKKEDE